MLRTRSTSPGARLRLFSGAALLLPLLFASAPPLHARGPAAVDQTLHVADVPVVTQDGERVRFVSDLVADKVVVMNFVFTSCTTICPPMGAHFGHLQKLLGDALGRDVRLISVSVDPTTDTPARLKAWGQRFGAGDGWTLVTGSKTGIDELLKSLQVFTPDFANHAPVVLVGSEKSGVWKRVYGLAPPQSIVALVEEIEAHEPVPAGGAGR